MLPENREFWIRGDDGKEYGPVGLEELREWVRENRAGLGTEVRNDFPGAAWQPWQNHPELVALLAEAQSRPPVRGFEGQAIAPLFRRVLAFLMDFILSEILSMPIFIVLALVYRPDWFIQFALASADNRFPVVPLPVHDEIIGSLISNIILALYMAGFHAVHGQTPAKSLMRLKVVDQNGNKPGFAKCLVRAFMLIFSLTLYAIPLTYAFFNPQRRTFHDFVAGTCVVEA